MLLFLKTLRTDQQINKIIDEEIQSNAFSQINKAMLSCIEMSQLKKLTLSYFTS